MRVALVQGASRGIGLEMVKRLVERGDRVVATCRNPGSSRALHDVQRRADGRVRTLEVDVTDESTIERAAHVVASEIGELDLLVNVSGLLHDGAMGPEKKLGHVEPAHLQRAFAVNAFGPLLVIKHFAELMVHGRRAVVANLSARVGSIGDNRLGGWYAYRASKAAQNMFTRTASIELARRSKALIVVALHPGTVDTALSKPFQRNVPPEKLFTVEHAASQLLHVIDDLTPRETGSFFAYDGTAIRW